LSTDRIVCRDCFSWDNEHPRLQFAPAVQGIADPGFCRKHRHASYNMRNDKGEFYAIGIQPITDGDETCGERRPKSE